MTGPKRVTEKQLAANRRNALKSTGPRTPQGKAVSRWNALKHGVLAKAIIPGPLEDYESRAEFDALLAALVDDLVPASPLEEMLVERIATCYWRLGRILRAEGAAIVTRQELQVPTSDLDELGLGAFGRTWPRTPRQRLDQLEAVMSNKRELRRRMTQEDPDLREASDEDLLAAAEVLRVDLAAQADREEQRLRALRQATRSVPLMETAAPLARYETTIERQLYRALGALERIKRLRGGDFAPPPGTLPPPLKITVDNSSDGGP